MSVVEEYDLRVDFPPPSGTETEQAEFLKDAADARLAADTDQRLKHLLMVESGGKDAIRCELEICGKNIFHWFKWYAWTYDPRNAIEMSPPLPSWLPFNLFPRQVELINWFEYLSSIKEDGCLKKSRDVGFTWLAAAISWHKYRFVPGFKTTFGSRKSEYVDRLGDPDSIFEKIRLLYHNLPHWMLPEGFNEHSHDNSMLMINPENGNTIRGEGGEEMGRGGRSTWYFIDEAAKLEHADRVDAATSANAEVRIWGSSINPQNENNLFQRKYTTFPAERVFRFHYSDDPRKTREWAERKQRSVSPEVWAAEYEIDDSYTVEDICIPSSWVQSSKRLKGLLDAKVAALTAVGDLEGAKKYRLEPAINGIAGGDVGGGKASSTVVARMGAIVLPPIAWKEPDTIDTALKMLDYAQSISMQRLDGHIARVKALRYDNVGIGHGVSAAMRRNPRPGLIVVGINVGESPSDMRWPDGETSEDKFVNLKAEGWWTLRSVFKCTQEMVLWLEDKEGGHEHPINELIALPDDKVGPLASRLASELSQPKWNRNEKGKVLIESKIAMAKRGLASPDVADGLVLTYAGYSKAEKWAAFAKVNI